MQCIIDVSVLRGDYPHAPEHAYHHSMCMESEEVCLGVSDRKSVESGKRVIRRVDLGGRGTVK